MSKLCSTCGSMLPDSAKFCPDCGQRQPAQVPVQETNFENPELALLNSIGLVNSSSEQNNTTPLPIERAQEKETAPADKIIEPKDIGLVSEKSHTESFLLEALMKKSQEMPELKEIPKGTHRDVFEEVSKEKPQEAPEENLEEPSEETSEESTEEVSGEVPEEKPQERPKSRENRIEQKISERRQLNVNPSDSENSNNSKRHDNSEPTASRRSRTVDGKAKKEKPAPVPDENGIIRSPIFGKSSRDKRDNSNPAEPRKRGEFKLRDENVQKELFDGSKKSIYEKKIEINKFEEDYDGYYENVLPDDTESPDIPVGKIKFKTILTFAVLGILVIGCIAGLIVIISTM